MQRADSVEQLPAEDWAGEMGERWLRHLERFESMIAPIGAALLESAGFRPAQRVLDLGCGAGGTSLEIARRVGPKGAVLGVDISAPLIAAAERRAQQAAADNVSFRCADAAIAQLPEAPFNRMFSRFGLMFFNDARAAFAHLRDHGLAPRLRGAHLRAPAYAQVAPPRHTILLRVAHPAPTPAHSGAAKEHRH